MNGHCIYCTVLVLGAFYINTLVLIVELIICSTRKRGVPTLGEFISTTTTTTTTWRPIRGLPNDCHVTEKGANFLLNTEKSRNNQAKVPNRTPFFTCIFEPPIKESSQKLTLNKYSHKKTTISTLVSLNAHL